MPEPRGYQPDSDTMSESRGPNQGQSNAAIAQLFARLSQEIEDVKPPNCIHFVVDFLCKHYPEHLHGFASIWNADPELERERQEVVNFFKTHKISTQIAAHFTNAGYDTLETLTTLSADSLVDVEAFNNVKWLPGHKVRLQQIFTDITSRIRSYKQEKQAAAGSYYAVPPQHMGQPAYHQTVYMPSGSHQQQLAPSSPQSMAVYASTTSQQFQSAPRPSPSVMDGRSTIIPQQGNPAGANGVPIQLQSEHSSTSTPVVPLAQSIQNLYGTPMPQSSPIYPMASQKLAYPFTPPQQQQLLPPALRLQSLSKQSLSTN
eukprot:GEMP01047940.1.p1 GENE.GEMP01047940.1~~GEMP01047940.1.p1  ORF type:complete len:316 (+),score=61.81 GEMP01047940.1:39-986(+)